MAQQKKIPTSTKRNLCLIIFMCIMTTLMWVLCIGFHYHARTNYGLLCLAFSIAVLLILSLNFYLLSIRMIFKDQETGYGNIANVMVNANKLAKKKKLNQYAGLFINIKELKYINQRYGVENGDVVVKEYAKNLDIFFKEHKGVVGRMGGDNYFAVVHKTELDEFLRYLNYILIPINIEGEERAIPVKCRVGINDATDNKDSGNIIFYASIALTVARETLRDKATFEPYMLDNFTHSKRIVAETRAGLKNNEFIPYYQPKVDAKTGKLVGCEALVRWAKNGSLIPPEEFIPVLEKNRLITEVDFFVFERVCKDLNTWISKGIQPVPISTNFSKLHLQEPNFIKHIIEVKDKYGIDGKYLEVELTETSDIAEYSLIIDFAKQIRAAGMHISIDDFGTGYSSLSLLQQIPVDVVKMDKSFLDNCFNDKSKQFIIDVMNIVKHQKEAILFEGVETREQFDFLQENGCDIIQGFYFDKPLYYTDFEKRLMHPTYSV